MVPLGHGCKPDGSRRVRFSVRSGNIGVRPVLWLDLKAAKLG